MKIVFYGDSELYLEQPLISFEYSDRIVMCDFTECGLWVASGLSKDRVYRVKPLSEYLSEYDENLPIESENCGIARFFKENKIKTLKDLKNHFSI